MNNLEKKKVAIIATDGFEEVELTSPKQALEAVGVEVHIVSENSSSIKAWNNGNWSKEYSVDCTFNDASESDYDALMIPGGVINPDKLRRNEKAVDFVRAFFKSHKPVSAICHGPWMLAEAGVLEGRKITSFHSIKTDMKNAGANWVDQEMVVDQGLVTSRSPADLPAFNAKMLEEVQEGKHAAQTV